MTRPAPFGDDTSVRYTSSVRPVRTDGVPMPSVLFGKRGDRRARRRRGSSVTSLDAHARRDRRLLVGRRRLRPEVRDACTRRRVADSPRPSRTSRVRRVRRRGRERDGDQHDAEVHDEAAVQPRVRACGAPERDAAPTHRARGVDLARRARTAGRCPRRRTRRARRPAPPRGRAPPRPPRPPS